MTTTQFFRAGVGTVIYTETGEIVLFQRADLPAIWQLPQGGLDEKETPENTLWRELKEETGLDATDVTCTHEYPDWLYYEYLPTTTTPYNANVIGQIHRWYFLQLKPTSKIDLTKATDQEFTDHKTGTFAALTTSELPHNQLKRAVYTKLANYYHAHILPQLPTI